VAVKEDVVQRYLSILKQAGLKPSALEPAPFSLVRLFSLGHQLGRGKPTAIVDVEYGMADINVVKDATCYLTRDTALPLEKEVIFDNLLNEIRMSLDYYEKLFPTEVIAKILLCGEVELSDWEKRLADELKLPIERANLSKVVKLGKVVPPLTMSVAISLALRGLVKSKKDVNLCKIEVKPKALPAAKALGVALEVRRAVSRGLIVSAIGLVLLFAIMTLRIIEQKKLLDNVISLRPTVSKEIGSLSSAEIEEMKDKLRKEHLFLKSFVEERVYWTNKLNELPKAIPPGVWLRNLSFDERLARQKELARSLTIQGVAYHQDPVREIEMVTRFVANLQENKLFAQGFTEIKMENMSSRQLNGFAVKNFTISCQK
jgi:Tfp pilus assembly protein PilN